MNRQREVWRTMNQVRQTTQVEQTFINPSKVPKIPPYAVIAIVERTKYPLLKKKINNITMADGHLDSTKIKFTKENNIVYLTGLVMKKQTYLDKNIFRKMKVVEFF